MEPMQTLKPSRTLNLDDTKSILRYQLQITETDTLIDLGCGVGVVLVQALILGCPRVVGIDSNPYSLKKIQEMLDAHGFSAWTCKTWGKPGMWGLCARLVNTRTNTPHILHIVCGDLGSVQLADLNAMEIHFSECTKLYLYGTVWPEQVKRNTIHLVNNMPGNPRLAWITAGSSGEPECLGLNQAAFPFQARASLNYLQTDTKDVAEMMSSFLYGSLDFHVPMGWTSAVCRRRERAVIVVEKSLENEAQALREWSVFKEECRKERTSKREALATLTSAIFVENMNPHDEDDADEGELLFEEPTSEDEDADSSYATDFIVNHSFDRLHLENFAPEQC